MVRADQGEEYRRGQGARKYKNQAGFGPLAHLLRGSGDEVALDSTSSEADQEDLAVWGEGQARGDLGEASARTPPICSGAM